MRMISRVIAGCLALCLAASPSMAAQLPPLVDATPLTITPSAGIQAPLASLLAHQRAPSGLSGCLVGDSRTIAGNNQERQTFAASGGNGTYTYALSGFPTGVLATQPSAGSATLNVVSSANYTLGTYTVTMTVTDGAGATGTATFALPAPTNNLFDFVKTSSSGTIAINRTITYDAESARGPGWIFAALTNRRVRFAQNLNFGHSGDTTTNILARLAEILAAPCDFYVLNIGTNNFNSGQSPTLASIEADLLNADGKSGIVQRLLAVGKPVIWEIPAVRYFTAASGSQAQQYGLARWIKSQAGTIPGLSIVDPNWMGWANPLSANSSPCTDAGGLAENDCAYDATPTHCKGVGCFAVFGPTAALLTQIMPDLGDELYGVSDAYSGGANANNPTGNLIPSGYGMMTYTAGNGTLTGATNATVSGTAPDGWIVQAVTTTTGSYTVAATQATLKDGFPAAQLVISGTAKGVANGFVELKYSFTSFANFAAGDMLHFRCKVEKDAGSTHVTVPFIQIVAITPADVQTHYQASGNVTNDPGFQVPADAAPAAALALTIATPTPARALTGAPSSLTLAIGFFVPATVSGAVSATWRIGECSLRKL